MRHGAILLSPYCVTVLGGRSADWWLDKQYAPAEPDEELRGPAQQAANGGGGGSGAMAPGAQPVRVRGPPVPPAHRGRQRTAGAGAWAGETLTSRLEKGGEQRRGLDGRRCGESNRTRAKRRRRRTAMRWCRQRLPCHLKCSTSLTVRPTARGPAESGQSRSPSPSPEVDYDAWVHDDGFC